MLTGIHFLLTMSCNFECDHCFLHCSPRAEGTFTLAQLHNVFAEIDKMPAIDNVYFEGGEPFLYHPLLIAGVGLAKERNLKIGIVSNSYWATSVEDAMLWLAPLAEAKITDLSLSSDEFHGGDDGASFARNAAEAARRCGIDASTICIEGPIATPSVDPQGKGEPVIGGGVKFRGRAVDKLTAGLPRKPFSGFTECRDEELRSPGRVHIDAHGNVHICQGISMGNIWQTPLAQLDAHYDAEAHPICGPLLEGGPVRLAEKYGVPHEDAYVDECHMCYDVRKALIDRFPGYLAPRQVYGLESI